MSYVLDRFLASGDEAELISPGSVKVFMQITNGRIQLAFGQGSPVPVYSDWESFLPIIGTLARRFDAIKARPIEPISTPPPNVVLTALPDGEAS